MTNSNPLDPSLALTPSIPFAYGNRPQNQWRMLPTTKDHPTWQDHELIIADLGGGLNKVWGRIFPHYLGIDDGDSAKTSSASGIDVSYPGQAILSTYTDSEAVWPGSNGGGDYYYCSCYMPNYSNKLFIAAGGSANNCLWQESGTTPGLSAVTYSPGASIFSLSALVFDSTGPVLTIGLSATNAVTLATNLSTTVTMNSSGTLWGGIVSPLNASNPGTPTNLLMIDSGDSKRAEIRTISGDQPASAVSVGTGTFFNTGGYAVDIANVAVTPGNLVSRAVWVIPRSPTTSGMMNNVPSERPGDIWHTNLYGTDPQKLITDLPYVIWCVVHNGVLYYTDGRRVMMNDGKEQDLGWAYEREPNSDQYHIAVGLGFANGNLVTQHCYLDRTTVANSLVQLEKYDSTAKVWYAVGTSHTTTDQVTTTFPGLGSIDRACMSYPIGAIPYSYKTQNFYMLPIASNNFKKDYFEFVPPAGYSHFWSYRFTAGSTHAGVKMEASGTWDSPALEMPWPLKGLPTVIIGMGLYGDVLAGGTGGSTTLASITVQQASQGITGTYTFSSTGKVYHKVAARDGLRWDSRWVDFGPERYDPFNRLKLRLTLTQDDSRTDWSPNGLPIVIRMRTFTDGRIE